MRPASPSMPTGVTKAHLKGEIESLSGFKKRVDGILGQLAESKASPTKIGDQRVVRASFGGNFNEADSLFHQYEQVHAQLTKLSSVLGKQIEAMRIAVDGAENGFQGIEDDVKRRFWQIATDVHGLQQAQKQEQEHGPRANDRVGKW